MSTLCWCQDCGTDTAFVFNKAVDAGKTSDVDEKEEQQDERKDTEDDENKAKTQLGQFLGAFNSAGKQTQRPTAPIKWGWSTAPTPLPAVTSPPASVSQSEQILAEKRKGQSQEGCMSFSDILGASTTKSRKDDNAACDKLRHTAKIICADIEHNGKVCTNTCLARMESQKDLCHEMQQCPILWR
jgi:hypothetical protein